MFLVILSLPFEIDSFKEFYFQKECFLDGKSIIEIYKEFTYFQFIELSKKWMVYPCLSKKKILDFYEEEMKMLIITR